MRSIARLAVGLVIGALPVLGLHAPAAFADRRPVQQPAVTATCDVYEVWASHGKTSMDTGIPKQLGTRLTNDFKYTEYKLLSKASKALQHKKGESVKLAKGSVSLTLLEIVVPSRVKLSIDFNAAKGSASGSPTIAAGDWYTVIAKQSSDAKADAHILGVSCK